MKVLVTGGAGYIGSHTLVELLCAGHEVSVIDNFRNSSKVALDRVAEITEKNFSHHEADIRDVSSLRTIFASFSPDVVIHFAGLKAVGESVQKPLEYYDVNVHGTICLLQAMNDAGCERIVFSSSATVYGEPQYVPIDEQHPCKPTNPYGRTKWMAEQMISDWQATKPSSAAILLRYFNPVGAYESGRIGENPRGVPNNLMPFIAHVATGRQSILEVYGDDYDTPDGTGIRDYIHVVDLARAHVAAADYVAQRTGSDAINIGTGRGYSVLEVVRAFEKCCGKSIPYKVMPRRHGDVPVSVANAERAHVRLGWKATCGVKEMCESAWRWHNLE